MVIRAGSHQGNSSMLDFCPFRIDNSISRLVPHMSTLARRRIILRTRTIRIFEITLESVPLTRRQHRYFRHGFHINGCHRSRVVIVCIRSAQCYSRLLMLYPFSIERHVGRCGICCFIGYLQTGCRTLCPALELMIGPCKTIFRQSHRGALRNDQCFHRTGRFCGILVKSNRHYRHFHNHYDTTFLADTFDRELTCIRAFEIVKAMYLILFVTCNRLIRCCAVHL